MVVLQGWQRQQLRGLRIRRQRRNHGLQWSSDVLRGLLDSLDYHNPTKLRHHANRIEGHRGGQRRHPSHMRGRLREAGALLGLQWRLQHHDAGQPQLSHRQLHHSCLRDAPGSRIGGPGDTRHQVHIGRRRRHLWNPRHWARHRVLGQGHERRGAPWGARRSHWGCLHRHGQPRRQAPLSLSRGAACLLRRRVIRVLLGPGGLRRAGGRGTPII